MNIPIVIPCYDRVDSLERLLKSLEEANYSHKVNIIFSLDKSDNEYIHNYLINYQWKYGFKEIIRHETKMGLKNNILYCGDLTSKYDAVIVLEDDLIVGKDFYNYATQAYNYYKEDDSIAGISLYKYEYSEVNRHKHYPIETGFDGYLMEWPSSWGQLWSKKQWKHFRTWLKTKSNINNYIIPIGVKKWGEKSWKKWAVAYLVDTNKYYLYPYHSFTNEFGTIGTHYNNNILIPNMNTVSLFEGCNMKYKFTNSNLCPKYDCFFQPKENYINIKGLKYLTTFNIYNSRNKNEIITPFVISPTKIEKSKIIAEFSSILIPYETNFKNTESLNDFFYLYKTDFYKSTKISVKKKLILNLDLTKLDYLFMFFLDLSIRIKRKLKLFL